MTRFTRTFVLPLLFATFGVSAVVAFGEPVRPVACAVEVSDDNLFAQVDDVAVVDAVEVAEVEEAAEMRSGEAARMRWSITLPSPRRSSCCRL